MATGSIYPMEHVGFSSILLTRTVTYSRCVAFVTHTPDGLLIQISQWNIAPVSSGALNVFTISPASDKSVGFFFPVDNEGKYWGYGFAKGRVGLSDNWRFKLSADGNYSTYSFSMFVTQL